MLNSTSRLLVTLGSHLAELGFVTEPGGRVFQRQRGELVDVVSIPIDLRGDCDVLVVSVNLCIVRKDTREMVTSNIGYLMPGKEWHEWEIDAECDSTRLAGELTRWIRHYGQPWWDAFQQPSHVTDAARLTVRHGICNVTRRPLRGPQVPTVSSAVL